MIPARLIEKKRDGDALDPEELAAFFRRYLEGGVHDPQMAAFLMAVHFRGLATGELDALVSTMIASGRTLVLDYLPGPVVDKHSTGGVGDKVSLPLAPLAAEMGLFVPMMSGRGLAHTGGTLDKLEAIPGFRTDLPLSAFLDVLERVGCAMTGQSAEIAPLDRRLYDLRSVTGTAPTLPLIAASIMSKKLAEGLDGLVLDVKAGEGAFIPQEEGALELARTMVAIGEARGVPTTALVTAMDRPLGRAVGNALETAEALETLRGEGPADLREVTLELASEMALSGGIATDRATARALAEDALDGGGALERFRRLVSAQGGDAEALDRPDRLPRAPEVRPCLAARDGVVRAIRPRALGWGVVELGGGRRHLGARIDPSVGFVLRVTPGDAVRRGDLLGEVHAARPADAERGLELLGGAVEVGDEADPVRPLVSHRVAADGVRVLVPEDEGS